MQLFENKTKLTLTRIHLLLNNFDKFEFRQIHFNTHFSKILHVSSLSPVLEKRLKRKTCKTEIGIKHASSVVFL